MGFAETRGCAPHLFFRLPAVARAERSPPPRRAPVRRLLLLRMKVTIKNWHAVACWTWTTEEDLCGICHQALDDSAPGAAGPGDESTVVWGKV